MSRLYPPDKPVMEAPPIPEWHHGDVAEPDELVVIYHNWDEIRRLMLDCVSIVRPTIVFVARCPTAELEKGGARVLWGHRVNADILEFRNLVAVGRLIVGCALRRRESRGPAFTRWTIRKRRGGREGSRDTSKTLRKVL